jgi:hypothetical protein
VFFHVLQGSQKRGEDGVNRLLARCEHVEDTLESREPFQDLAVPEPSTSPEPRGSVVCPREAALHPACGSTPNHMKTAVALH